MSDVSKELETIGMADSVDGVDGIRCEGSFARILDSCSGFKPAPRQPPNIFESLNAFSLPLRYATTTLPS